MNTHTSVWMLATIAAIGGLVAMLLSRSANKCRIVRFNDREAMPMFRLSREYFPEDDPALVERCLNQVASVTGIDVGRLRPGDRFQVELKLPQGAFIAGEWDDLEDEIGKRGGSSSIATIADYIRFVGTISHCCPKQTEMG